MTLLLAILLTMEQSYGPYARPLNGGDAAVAPAHGGALLAWSEENRIRIGFLNARGLLSSELHTLPAQTSRSVAVAPVAASDGNAYFVAWVELEGTMRTMGMIVAPDGSPVGEPRQYGKALNITSNDFPLRLVWNGTTYRLWGGGKVSTIDRNGNVLATLDAAQVPSGVAASNGGVIATSSNKLTLNHCGLYVPCTASLYVTWTIGGKPDSVRIEHVTSNMLRTLLRPSTVIAAAREQFVVAWSAREGIRYLVPGDGSNGVAASPDTSTPPGLACDDNAQCVIAYAQSKDVHAFAFPIDQLRGPELLTIAATERTERVPQVHVLGDGRFLVLYRSDGSDGTRMSWRVADFGSVGPTRQRSIR